MGQFWMEDWWTRIQLLPAGLAVSHQQQPYASFHKGWISGLHAAVDGVEMEDQICRGQASIVSQKGAIRAQSTAGGLPHQLCSQLWWIMDYFLDIWTGGQEVIQFPASLA